MSHKESEKETDREVRIRMLEEGIKYMSGRFDKLDESFINIRKTLISIVVWTLISVIIPVALHYFKLD